jgi:DNA modification methylase
LELIIQGDARDISLPDKSVNCVITSPPYWSLRKYEIPDSVWDGNPDCEHEWGNKEIVHKSSPPTKWQTSPPEIWTGGKSSFCKKCGAWLGQLGLEPHYNDYVRHLVDIFDTEIRRVLRDDGTLFVNLGDSYGGSGGDSGKKPGAQRKGPRGLDSRPVGIGQDVVLNERGNIKPPPSVKFSPKSLLLIPERFALAMTDKGWILRNKIIWEKPNSMPHSARDRFTNNFEPIYFFSKQKSYFFDQQFEPFTRLWDADNGGSFTSGRHKDCGGAIGFREDKADYPLPNPWGRNLRAVWNIPTQSYREAHYAVFPEALVERMIRAGVPAEVCKKCKEPRRRIYKSIYEGEYDHSKFKSRPDPRDDRIFKEKNMGQYRKELLEVTNCGCNAVFEPGVVLDPFAGSGTTVRVAEKLNRVGIGIDLGYQDLSEKRTTDVQKEWF